ncbi:hypothetical protein AA101099_2833 [Neoasaia chiangmaiensis NBRC 101099]|nr:hypothetical protein [Neoasaia chiangmaiensis]GBR42324.1 hypothetical protein AA101099_2833 [Neoasaia chiangmaiensis NBRC 101099]GEN14089.1 hypothetical protein NCH01_05200 [Neoasaia chiangmaiensis]
MTIRLSMPLALAGALLVSACSQPEIDHTRMHVTGMTDLWRQQGYSYADARMLERNSITPQDAAQWKALGVSPSSMVTWTAAGYTPGTALPYLRAGVVLPTNSAPQNVVR